LATSTPRKFARPRSASAVQVPALAVDVIDHRRRANAPDGGRRPATDPATPPATTAAPFGRLRQKPSLAANRGAWILNTATSPLRPLSMTGKIKRPAQLVDEAC
jgi:hypothetical protein